MLFISITLHDRRDYLDATFCAVNQRKIRGCTWRDFTVISRLIENWGWLANAYVVIVLSSARQQNLGKTKYSL